MGLIRVLPGDLIDRIAAGEVIERPASVAKELLENAIDAGATSARVTLSEGGLGRLVVEDDGAGMSREDAHTCLLRHATSKLRSDADLFSIRTLGFRGEALSSIAAVSRLTLTTRRAEDPVATRIMVEGGEIRGVEDVGAPPGTTFDVRDLFFNTPARRKFMRSPSTEQAHVVEAALRVSLGARRGGVVVAAGERRLLDIPEDAPEADRIIAALGGKIDAVYELAHELEGARVSGAVTAPEVDRADAKGMWFFVNGRYVRDRMLQRAVLDGYRTMVERGRFPICVIYLDVEPSAVDVNVHPQKLEVRFRDGSSVFRAVSAAVTSVLARTPWLQRGGVRRAVDGYLTRARELGRAQGAPWTRPHLQPSFPAIVGEDDVDPIPVSAGAFSRLRPLGTALGGYLVCEGDGELVLIDRRAAREHLVFARLREEAAGEGVRRQPLLFPEVLELTTAAQELLERRWQELGRYGFEIEAVGPSRWAVRAIPAALEGCDARALAAALLEEIERSQDTARVLSRCARHAVVGADATVDLREARTLLGELDHLDVARGGPYQRPIAHRWAPPTGV